MANFNLGALRQWRQVGAGELILLQVPTAGVRTVELDYIADVPVTVRAVSGDFAPILAHAAGFNSLRFVIDADTGVTFHAPADADIFVRTKCDTQVVIADGEESFTSIEPRQPSQSDDVARMMRLMHLNQMRREQALRDEFEERLSRQERSERAPSLRERQLAEVDPIDDDDQGGDDAPASDPAPAAPAASAKPKGGDK